MDIDRGRYSARPRSKTRQLILRVDGRLHCCHKLGERTDIKANCMTTERKSFHQCGAAPNMRVQHKVARPRESFDHRPHEDRRKAGRILIEAMGQTSHRSRVTRAGDERRLDL